MNLNKELTFEDILDNIDCNSMDDLSYEDSIMNLHDYLNDSNIIANEAYLTLELLQNNMANEAFKIELRTGLHKIIDKLKEVIYRIFIAIQDFFKNIMVMIQSKLFKYDVKLLYEYGKIIKNYYESPNSDKNITVNVTNYAIPDPISNYILDKKLLEEYIPELCNIIKDKIHDIETGPQIKIPLDNPIQSATHPIEMIKTTMGNIPWDKEALKTSEYKHLSNKKYPFIETLQEFYSKLLKKSNTGTISELNISQIIRDKYYGSEKKKVDKSVKLVISKPEDYFEMISEDNYNAFKTNRNNYEQIISDIKSKIREFTDNAAGLEYDLIAFNLSGYIKYMNILFKIPLTYWNLYYDLRNTCIICMKAIINNYKI